MKYEDDFNNGKESTQPRRYNSTSSIDNMNQLITYIVFEEAE